MYIPRYLSYTRLSISYSLSKFLTSIEIIEKWDLYQKLGNHWNAQSPLQSLWNRLAIPLNPIQFDYRAIGRLYRLPSSSIIHANIFHRSYFFSMRCKLTPRGLKDFVLGFWRSLYIHAKPHYNIQPNNFHFSTFAMHSCKALGRRWIVHSLELI